MRKKNDVFGFALREGCEVYFFLFLTSHVRLECACVYATFSSGLFEVSGVVCSAARVLHNSATHAHDAEFGCCIAADV